ncbi:Rrf2 family transcriptional regulator [Steroidobacter cummioxidans]|uniref:Rrf2 family transcriptional regulator n=1 Tax=Steroidobacter cummioxidans TaxID=1803913 RepID=UPI000E316DE1|nr:Rrf2 family transcriptional regulator [Steroidobacter cummioxidans]
MRNDSRLSRMLHVLLHMARHDQPFTSEQIAKMLDTNPVVVRRTMAGLREAGYVQSEKGHGGGWMIACDLKNTTLLDVYKAVAGDRLFVIGHESENPTCAVARTVNTALNDVLQQAEVLVMKRLGAIALADLVDEFDMLCRDAGWDVKGSPAKRRRKSSRRPRNSMKAT